MDFPRIPVENWSNEELYEAVVEFFNSNVPSNYAVILREFYGRGLKMDYETWTKIVSNSVEI